MIQPVDRETEKVHPGRCYLASSFAVLLYHEEEKIFKLVILPHVTTH